jgi:hypothetical protein
MGEARMNSSVPWLHFLLLDGEYRAGYLPLQEHSTLYNTFSTGASAIDLAVSRTPQYICYSAKSDPFIFNPRADSARYGTIHPCLANGKAPDLSPLLGAHIDAGRRSTARAIAHGRQGTTWLVPAPQLSFQTTRKGGRHLQRQLACLLRKTP